MNELETLKKQYRADLKSKAASIHNYIQGALHDIGCKKAPKWKEIEQVVHKLAGSAGTYGFGALSRILSHLESALVSEELQGLKKDWAARYLQSWQTIFDRCVRQAVEETSAKQTPDLNYDLQELDQLLHAREVA